jgi:hypothetical protein
MKYFFLYFIFLVSCSVKNTSQLNSNSNVDKQITSSNNDTDFSNLYPIGRKVTKRNVYKIIEVINNTKNENTQIATKVCIDKSGHVTYVELIERETTSKLTTTQKKQVLKAVYGYEYEASNQAPSQECGKLTIKLAPKG